MSLNDKEQDWKLKPGGWVPPGSYSQPLCCTYKHTPHIQIHTRGPSLVVQSVKNPPEMQETTCNAGNSSSIPRSGRSPGEGNGNPLQCSCLGNPMDRGAWWATVHRVTRICRHDLVTKPSPSHILEANTQIFKYMPCAHTVLLAPVEMVKLLSRSDLDSPFESGHFTPPYLSFLGPLHSHTTAFLPKLPCAEQFITGGAGKAPSSHHP